MIDSAAFDAVASEYDSDFTDSRLGRWLRARVWQILARQFAPGQQVLELTCGTGEDALWLAQRGAHVTATDGSAEMLKIAVAKAEETGLRHRVTFHVLSLQDLTGQGVDALRHLATANGQSPAPPPFDGVYSNFGGLNTVSDWRPLARALSEMVRPGGKVVLVPMGPFCPWEIGWHLLHGQLRAAFRRFGDNARARVGTTTIPVWYPGSRRLRRHFQPWFRHQESHSLGLWLPPTYLAHLVERWPRLFHRLDRIERATSRLTRGWGDHYITVFERVN